MAYHERYTGVTCNRYITVTPALHNSVTWALLLGSVFLLPVLLHPLPCLFLLTVLFVHEQDGIFLPVVEFHVLVQSARRPEALHQGLRLLLPATGFCDKSGATF